MYKISVYSHAEDLDQTHLADILLDENGSMDLNIFAPGPEATKLQASLETIRADDSLSVRAEEQLDVDGVTRLVMTNMDIKPGDSGYEWALQDRLVRYGFWCEIESMDP